MEKNLLSAFARGDLFLMEGALGERLKRDSDCSLTQRSPWPFTEPQRPDKQP